MNFNSKKWLVFVVIIVCAFSNIVFASDFGMKKDIGVEKIWRVDLNNIVDEASLTNKNISIKDDFNQLVHCKFRLENGGKTIAIIPDAYYEYGQNYDLFISNLKSINNKILTSDVTMSFEIKELSLKERKEMLKAHIVQGISDFEGSIDVSKHRVPYEDFLEIKSELNRAGLLRGVMVGGSESEEMIAFLEKYVKPGSDYAEKYKDFRGEPGTVGSIVYAYPEGFQP